jgi:hypothetical protein
LLLPNHDMLGTLDEDSGSKMTAKAVFVNKHKISGQRGDLIYLFVLTHILSFCGVFFSRTPPGLHCPCPSLDPQVVSRPCLDRVAALAMSDIKNRPYSSNYRYFLPVSSQ